MYMKIRDLSKLQEAGDIPLRKVLPTKTEQTCQLANSAAITKLPGLVLITVQSHRMLLANSE